MNTLDDELIELAAHLDAEMRLGGTEPVVRPPRQPARSRHRLVSVAAATMLVAAGVAGLAIVNRGDRAEPSAGTTPSGTAQPAGSTPTVETTPGTDAPPTTTPTVTLERALSVGDAGDDVAAVQTYLANQFALDPGPQDGTFGEFTLQAVWALETLILGRPLAEATGQITPETWQQVLAAGPVIPRRSDPGATHVEVYLPEQALAVFHNGAPVLVAHISSGALDEAGNPLAYCQEATFDVDENGAQLDAPETREVCGYAKTPGGVFRVTSELAGAVTTPLGGMINPVFFNYGIAIHGAFEVPPFPASHGAVRISQYLADSFPDLVEPGDPVYVWDGTHEPEDVPADEQLPSFDAPASVRSDIEAGAAVLPTDNGLGDVLLGSVEIEGEHVGVAVVDGGNGLCRTLADGTRAGCDTIGQPGPTTLGVHFTAGDLVYGYTLEEVTYLEVTVDGKPLDVARAPEVVEYGAVSLRMWAARLPDAESGHRVNVSVGDEAP